LTPGTLIEGRFEIERKIASGGMGAVFRAIDRLDGAPVAVKFLHTDKPLAIERFAREAALLAELQHPGIVRYIAHGVQSAGRRYLVMEWLEGEDLEHRLARQKLTPTESLTLLHQVTCALMATHSRGVLHRDIKPSNIFLVGGSLHHVKLLDFGVARLIHEAVQLTAKGTVVGTPAYMAPEQAKGQTRLDTRADVFSLGCVLFECLTGRPPFEGVDAMVVLTKILLQKSPRLRTIRPDLPEALERLVDRMLAKHPDERPRDATEVESEIKAFQSSSNGWAAPGDHGRKAPAELPTATIEQVQEAALTLTEQRIVSVVLASASHQTEPTVTVDFEALELDLYGGRLNVLANGAMVVTIGGAGSPIDRAARAARCALTLRERFPHVSICVVTGRGVVSARVVEGDVIDRGVRALRAAQPGCPVQLDAVTAEMLSQGFIIEPERGAFVLRGELPRRHTRPLFLGKPTPCVGRSREIVLLEAAFSGCVEELQANAVLVTGPAGSGKSRLCYELLEKLQRRGKPVEVLSGRADSLAKSSPFGIIGDALREAAEIHGGEPPEIQRRKLISRLSRHLDGLKLARASAFLGEMTGIPFPDESDAELRNARSNAQIMGDGMRAAWEDWLAVECAAQPVVLVLEDLHWGDEATTRLLDSTLRNLRDMPLLMLVMARPEIHARFPGLFAGRDVQSITLAPLTPKVSEQLVREALGKDANGGVVAQIVERAEGNPFSLEELIRTVASGRGDALPDSVLGMVEARLDAEGAEAKRVLRAASVFGERFSARGVASLLGGGLLLDKTAACLERLAERELVTAVPLPTRATHAEDAIYTFRHALVREAAYAALTESDRALGHRLAGAWLEESGSASAVILAEHFQRGGEPLRAVRWYRRAAEQALAADDLAAALERTERGFSCGAAGVELGALRLIEAEVHVWRGELAVAEQRGVEATELLAPGTVAWFRAVTQVVFAAGKLGSFDQVEHWLDVLRDTTPAKGARTARIICLCACAGELCFGGRYGAAEARLKTIDREVYEHPAHDAPAIAALEQVRAFRASAARDSGAGLDHFHRALVAFEQAGDRRNACICRSNLGCTLAELGDFAGAEEALRVALASAERMGMLTLTAVVVHNLGHVLACRGQLTEARLLEQRAVGAFQRQGDLRMEGSARTYLAKIELRAGDLAAAEREARAAEKTLVAAPPLRAAALAVLGHALLEQGRVSEALAFASEAYGLLASLGSIEEGESLVCLLYAEALAASGRMADFAMAITDARDRLLARAAKISDPMWRERFLTNVSENARTLSLAPPVNAAAQLKCG
jgi:eukaryotic-like serine/threonine-protein kinase